MKKLLLLIILGFFVSKGTGIYPDYIDIGINPAPFYAALDLTELHCRSAAVTGLIFPIRPSNANRDTERSKGKYSPELNLICVIATCLFLLVYFYQKRKEKQKQKQSD